MTASKASEPTTLVENVDRAFTECNHLRIENAELINGIEILRDQLQKAEARAAEAELERDEARTHGMRLLLSDKTTRFCAYCQTVVSGDNSFEEIQDHIKQCTKHPMTVAIKRAETAEAQAVAAELDAGRYRWLRVQHWHESALCVVSDPKRVTRLGADCPSDERLDAAIDAAIAALRRSAP